MIYSQYHDIRHKSGIWKKSQKAGKEIAEQSESYALGGDGGKLGFVHFYDNLKLIEWG